MVPRSFDHVDFYVWGRSLPSHCLDSYYYGALQAVCVCVYGLVFLFVCLFVVLFVCLFACLFVCLGFFVLFCFVLLGDLGGGCRVGFFFWGGGGGGMPVSIFSIPPNAEITYRVCNAPFSDLPAQTHFESSLRHNVDHEIRKISSFHPQYPKVQRSNCWNTLLSIGDGRSSFSFFAKEKGRSRSN